MVNKSRKLPRQSRSKATVDALLQATAHILLKGGVEALTTNHVAEMAGVINVDERWCKVDFLTYESTEQKNVHVIGDAIAAKLPKSGHMANAQAKVCAAAVVSLLKEQLPEQEPVINNTCYSFVDNKQAVHVAAVYRYDKEQKTMKAMPGGGVSKQASELEGAYADAWAKNIWADALS